MFSDETAKKWRFIFPKFLVYYSENHFQREAKANDFEENRENLGPVQSPDGVAAGVITLILQVVILLKLFDVI